MSMKFKSAALPALAAAASLVLALTGNVPPAYAASVIEAGGPNGLELKDAIANAQDGDTVRLVDNVSVAEKVTISKAITLDLNGKSITSSVTGSALGAISINNSSKDAIVAIEDGTLSAPTAQGINVGWQSKAGIEINGVTIASEYESVYLDNSPVKVKIVNSSLTANSTAAVDVTDGGTADSYVEVNGSSIANEVDKPVISIGFKFRGRFVFTGDSLVTGATRIVGPSSQDPYSVEVQGGRFGNGDALPFVGSSTNEELLKRLDLRGGYFKTNVTSLTESGYVCVPSGPDAPEGYGFQVIKYVGTVTPFYTQSASGVRTYYNTFADAAAAAKADGLTLFVAEDAEIPASLDLHGLIVASVSGAKLSYASSLADLLGTGVALKNATVACTDFGVSDASSVAGKLESGRIVEGSSELAGEFLAEGRYIWADNTPGQIVGEESCSAAIGHMGYVQKQSAVFDAMRNDSEDAQVNDVIEILDNDPSLEKIEVVLPYACFTLNLNGCTVDGSGSYALAIAPKTVAPTSVPHNANITVRNGTLIGKTFGVATNGTVENVQLKLENVDVVSEETAAYLPAGGSTTIIGGTYTGKSGIQLCGGSLTVDGAKITATGQPEEKNPGDDGAVQDGAAVSVIRRDGYPKLGTVEIKGGAFVSADGIDPVQAYAMKGDNKPAEWPDAGEKIDVSGGSFSAPIDDTLFAEGFGGSLKPDANGNFVVVSEQQYTVRHLFEELESSNYVQDEALAKTETLVGAIDGQTKAEAKRVEGFTALPVEQQTIASDGGTVVDVRYRRNRYSVTFDSKGGSEVVPVTGVKFGAKVAAPASPTRKGYAFQGWFEADAQNPFDFNAAVTRDLVLEARWSKDEPTPPKPPVRPVVHKVTFVPVVGENERIVVTVEDGELAPLPKTPVREGYAFEGWFYDQDGTRAFDADEHRIESDLTLYGKWRKDEAKPPVETPEGPTTPTIPSTPTVPTPKPPVDVPEGPHGSTPDVDQGKPAPKPDADQPQGDADASAKPAPDKAPAGSATHGADKLPGTGDDSMVAILVLGLGGIAIVVAGIVIARRRNK